jgi:ribosomal protein S6
MMQKRDHGTYVRMRFELDAGKIATLRERYHLIEDLFRVQILAVNERRESVVAEQAAKRRAREERQAAAQAAAAAAQAAPAQA